jgi:hypothetical protein
LKETTSSQPALCPHCKTPGSGKLCSQCGENLHPKRITFAKLIKDIPDVFFDLEYGLLYTIRTFLTRPGAEIKEYFAGDRQKHYKPVKFVIFVAGLATLLFIFFDINDGTERAKEDIQEVYSAAILLLQFPLISVGTWLFFRNRKYTFGEHLVANAFLIGEVVLFNIVFFPVYLMLNGTQFIGLIALLYIFWIIFYYTYVLYDWFYEKKTTAGFFKSLGVTLLLFVIVQLLTVLVTPLLRAIF